VIPFGAPLAPPVRVTLALRDRPSVIARRPIVRLPVVVYRLHYSYTDGYATAAGLAEGTSTAGSVTSGSATPASTGSIQTTRGG